MNLRKTILALSVAAAAAPAAFADNFVGGEAGWDTSHAAAVTSTRTREQVQREYEAFRAHPVLSDGTVVIQGEVGYVSANQAVGFDNTPSGPHTHALGNAAAPAAKAAPLTEAERRAYQDQYVN